MWQVSGGGRKPHAQKGTGRARQGSTRSPVNRGGGHAHAKVPRDFSFDLNKKVAGLLGVRERVSMVHGVRFGASQSGWPSPRDSMRET